MDQTTFYALIGAVGVVCGIVFGFIGYSQGRKKDYFSDGSEKGSLKSDISYIMKRSDDMLLEQRDTNNKLNNLSERVTRVEESTKSAHKRLDTIDEKGGI